MVRELAETFYLKHKDETVARFTIGRNDVIEASIYKETLNALPLPLQRIVNFADEFIAEETDTTFAVNDDGCCLFDMWLSDREIPSNRDQYDLYVRRGHTARQWMLNNNALGFTDCYWITQNAKDSWNAMKLKLSDVDQYESVREHAGYSGVNSTLGGELEKFWYKSNGVLKLCKKVPKPYDVLCAREVFASKIYESLGVDHCHYEYVFDKTGDVIGCKCVAFTSERFELITAFDLLEAHNRTQQPDVYDLIIQYALELGAEASSVRDYLDTQMIVDYVITNRDRHLGNIGFLRDSTTLKIVKPAPIYDSGSSKRLEGAYPESVTETTINGLFRTDLECLQRATKQITKFPPASVWESVLNSCNYVSNVRREQLLKLYTEKVKYVKANKLKTINVF